MMLCEVAGISCDDVAQVSIRENILTQQAGLDARRSLAAVNAVEGSLVSDADVYGSEHMQVLVVDDHQLYASLTNVVRLAMERVNDSSKQS